MHDLPPQGSIEDIFPPRLIAGLHVQEFEGMLRLALPDAIKVLYFRKGEIASAASNAEPDRLANILMAEGRLTAEQLELARARLQAGASLGKALIEMGFLSPSELLQGARQQVKIIVSSCFVARTGTYEMIPGPLPPEVTSLGLNTRRLLFDALVELGDRASVIREVGSMEAVYRPTERLGSVLASLRLDVEFDRIGRHLDGSATLREVSGRTSHDDFTVSKVVLALELMGGAESLSAAEEEASETDSGREIPVITDTRPEQEAQDSVEIIVEEPGSEIPDQEPFAQEPAEPDFTAQVPAGTAAPDPTPVVEAEPPAAVALGEAIEAAPLAGAPQEPAADEPPPIPQEELPAFARQIGEPSAPAPGPDDEPIWQVDPETGERVHVGPIEMTFDGRIAQGAGEPRNLMWILLAAGAITLVVAGSLGYVILRRGTGAPAVSAMPSAAEAGQGTAGASEPPSGSAVAAVPEEPARAHAAPSIAPAPVEEKEQEGPVERPAAPERRAAAVTPPATTPSLPAERSRADEAGGPAVSPGFTKALQRLDQGDAAAAAHQFEEWIRSQNPRQFSLQLMIACQEETVRSARKHAADSSSLFILPYTLKERSCYRVCWGIYDDVESARAAVPSIPSALTSETAPPIVPLSRLRSEG
jgi:hypothetical protein